jgi:hypothetical protein
MGSVTQIKKKSFQQTSRITSTWVRHELCLIPSHSLFHLATWQQEKCS